MNVLLRSLEAEASKLIENLAFRQQLAEAGIRVIREIDDLRGDATTTNEELQAKVGLMLLYFADAGLFEESNDVEPESEDRLRRTGDPEPPRTDRPQSSGPGDSAGLG